MIGRMLYDLNEMDTWEVILFFKGLAGSGKGSILTKVIKEFYEADDIGVLSNNIEKVFGLINIANKKLFIAPEVKQDFALDQAVFQSMVSAEDISLAEKNKSATKLVWKVPGVLAGNVLPAWTDNSGSISRRMIVAEFPKKVNKKDSDPLLGKKLKKEIPNIIQKCNKAYLEAVKKYSKKNIWPVLPEYFRNTQALITEQTNILQHFLNSGKVSFGQELYIKESVFKLYFTQHCRENNYQAQKWSTDLYIGPFNDFSEKHDIDIKIVRNKTKEYPRGSGKKVLECSNLPSQLCGIRKRISAQAPKLGVQRTVANNGFERRDLF